MNFFRNSLFITACALQLSLTDVHAKVFSQFEVDLGYNFDKGPVCPTPTCLLPQVVFGASTTVYTGTAVSPSIAVNPKQSSHMVACWQQDRISNGGSLEVGIGHTNNSGKSWHHSSIPLQSCHGGIIQRISNSWVTYSKDGKIVYLTALVFNATQELNTQDQSGIIIVTSEDNGKSWGVPRYLASSQWYLNEQTGLFPLDDKPSVTSDLNEPKYAYTVWDRFPLSNVPHGTTQISRTTDKGRTWSPFQTLYNPFPDLLATNLSNGNPSDNSTTNNIIVVQPKISPESRSWKHNGWGSETNKSLRLNGDVLNFMVRIYAKPTATNAEYITDQFPFQYTLFDIALVRSKDFGITWDGTAKVVAPFVNAQVYTGGYTYSGSQVTGGIGTHMRTGDITPSYSVNPHNGFLYVVWQSGQFRADQLPQIALSTSRDGGYTWSQPVMISRTPQDALNPQAFNPVVAITKDGYVGVFYYDFRNDKKENPNKTITDAWVAIYKEIKNPQGGNTGIGLEFVQERRMSLFPFIAQNGPVTTQGTMTTGDYPAMVAHGNHFFAAYTKSQHGPFNPSTLIQGNQGNNTYLILDNNYRQIPVFSRIKQ